MENLFTTRLLERYQQTTSAITPRVRSLFEPDTGTRNMMIPTCSPETPVLDEPPISVGLTHPSRDLHESLPATTPHSRTTYGMPSVIHRHTELKHGMDSSNPSTRQTVSGTPLFSAQPESRVANQPHANPLLARPHDGADHIAQPAGVKSTHGLLATPSGLMAATQTSNPVTTVPPLPTTNIAPRQNSIPVKLSAEADIPARFNAVRERGILQAPESLPVSLLKQEIVQNPPSINITIGRLEVRANTAASKKPRSQATLRQPVMGLDEYLKSRGGR